MSVNIGDIIQDGSVVWTVGRKITNAPNFIADCDSVMEGSIKQFDSTTSNIPAVGAEGNLVTVGLASSKAQIAVTSDSKVYYRSYTSSAWGTWQRLTTASEIVDSMSVGISGYVKFGSLLGGLTVQWGTVPYVGDPVSVTYPITFANGCSVVQLTPGAHTKDINMALVQVDARNSTASGFKAWINSSSAEYRELIWFAIGY